MSKIDIPYWPDEPESKPLPKQLEAHKKNKRFRMLSGAVRAGKTLWGCQEGLKLSFKWNGNTGAIVRSTLTELKRTTQVTFFRIFGCTAENIKTHPLVKSWNKNEQHLTFINGSDIYFVGIENWTVLKSLELGWVFADEGVDIKSSALQFLRTRLNKVLPYDDFNEYFFTATNPGDENHILYKWFIKIPETEAEKKDREKCWCGFTTSYDNVYLSDDYKDEFESWRQDKEFYDRYVMGKWGRFKGLVYTEYDEKTHLIREGEYDRWMAKIREVYCGNDWGFTNPAAILFFGITGDGEVIQFDEIYVTQKTNPELRELYFKKKDLHKINPRVMYSDPEEPSDIQEFRNNGIPTQKANNSIEAGIKKVKEYLRLGKNGQPRYRIFERCINTRKEFGLYRRPDDDEISEKKNVPELPIDKDNHAMAGLRYFFTTHFLGTSRLLYQDTKAPVITKKMTLQERINRKKENS
jgi:PBSX family phage terminase large subunit